MVQKPEKTLTAKAVGREFVRQVKMIMNCNFRLKRKLCLVLHYARQGAKVLAPLLRVEFGNDARKQRRSDTRHRTSQNKRKYQGACF